jgi:hypothetical protein
MSKRIGDLLEGQESYECCICDLVDDGYFMAWIISIPYEQEIVITFCSDSCEGKAKEVLRLPEYSCTRSFRQMLKDAGNLEYPYKKQ